MKKQTKQENPYKNHKCDGGDDYGRVGCLKCEKEMLWNLKNSSTTTPSKKVGEIHPAIELNERFYKEQQTIKVLPAPRKRVEKKGIKEIIEATLNGVVRGSCGVKLATKWLMGDFDQVTQEAVEAERARIESLLPKEIEHPFDERDSEYGTNDAKAEGFNEAIEIVREAIKNK